MLFGTLPSFMARICCIEKQVDPKSFASALLQGRLQRAEGALLGLEGLFRVEGLGFCTGLGPSLGFRVELRV